LDFPVQDFGMFGSVKFREVMTDIQHETYKRCDVSALFIFPAFISLSLSVHHI